MGLLGSSKGISGAASFAESMPKVSLTMLGIKARISTRFGSLGCALQPWTVMRAFPEGSLSQTLRCGRGIPTQVHLELAPKMGWKPFWGLAVRKVGPFSTFTCCGSGVKVTLSLIRARAGLAISGGELGSTVVGSSEGVPRSCSGAFCLRLWYASL